MTHLSFEQAIPVRGLAVPRVSLAGIEAAMTGAGSRPGDILRTRFGLGG
ncbi:hypothetical protein [Chitiniphilus eburneus]|nr:hypothetical protein [Chitiniphilus eburneus]